MRSGPKGITTQIIKAGAIITSGAVMKTHLSAWEGMMSSLITSFRASKRVWKMPWGPWCIGPGRRWMRPATFRSSQIRKRTLRSRKVRTATPLRTAIKATQTHSGMPRLVHQDRPAAYRLPTH